MVSKMNFRMDLEVHGIGMIETFAPGIQTLDCGQYLIGVCPGGESRWQIGRPEQGG
jgi:hypothetical protein